MFSLLGNVKKVAEFNKVKLQYRKSHRDFFSELRSGKKSQKLLEEKFSITGNKNKFWTLLFSMVITTRQKV